jgi:hypothetical protein
MPTKIPRLLSVRGDHRGERLRIEANTLSQIIRRIRKVRESLTAEMLGGLGLCAGLGSNQHQDAFAVASPAVSASRTGSHLYR